MNACQPVHIKPAESFASPCGQLPVSRPGGTKLEIRSVTRFPQQLRLHPAFEQVAGVATVDDLNRAGLLRNEPIANHASPVLITKRGVILDGIGRWRIALLEGISEIHCIEYEIGEDEALSFILSRHRAQRQWNRFVRVCLALTLEPALQERALMNMKAGGRLKGSAKLPEAHHIDVREQIGNLAGVSAHYVSDVKAILRAAHSKLIEALTNGTPSIPRALRLIKHPKLEQLQRFTQEFEERCLDKVIRECVRTSDKAGARQDVIGLLGALLKLEIQRPGSIRLRQPRSGATCFIFQDLSTSGILQEKLKLT